MSRQDGDRGLTILLLFLRCLVYYLGCVVYCYLVGSLLVWISAQARGVQEYLGTAIHTLGEWWRGSPRYLPWFVFVLIFLALRMLLAPFLLTHRRMENGKDRQKQTHDEALTRAVWRYLLVAVFEALLLIFLTHGVEGSAFDWSADQFALAFSNPVLANDGTSAAIGMLCFLGSDAVVRYLLLITIELSSRRFHDTEALTSTTVAAVLAELAIYAPVFYILLLKEASHPYLCTLLLSFLGVRALTTWGYAFLSICADDRMQLAS